MFEIIAQKDSFVDYGHITRPVCVVSGYAPVLSGGASALHGGYCGSMPDSLAGALCRFLCFPVSASFQLSVSSFKLVNMNVNMWGRCIKAPDTRVPILSLHVCAPVCSFASCLRRALVFLW